MLNLDLLHSFVSVVDAGGFTRAGDRVHRTQSTVSQQIKRLEEAFGRPLLNRDGKRVTVTDAGERLLSYARRILALAGEAQDVVARPESDGVVRLGIPEDFAAYRLARALSEFVRSSRGLRLDVRCKLSVDLQRDFDRGELDLALLRREVAQGGGVCAWRERLAWVTSQRHPVDLDHDPVPLAVFPQGCLYRNRAIHSLEAAGRTWRVAYASENLSGIQAAVSVGLGVSILPEVAVLDDHRVLKRKDGFPPITNTQLALLVAPDATSATRRVADLLADFCGASTTRNRSIQPVKRRSAPTG